LLFSTMFLNMAITGFLCQSDPNTFSSAIKAILIQKVVLALLYQLMVKKPKKKMIKFDPDLKVKPPKEKDRPKPELTMSYKLSPCDKVSLAIGYFLIFAIIGGSLFFGLLKSQQISESDNSSWITAFVLSLLIDLIIFEFIAITFGALLLKHVGSHPAAMGPLRNYVIKFGPRVIRDARVETAVPRPKPKKQKLQPSSDRKVQREKQAPAKP